MIFISTGFDHPWFLLLWIVCLSIALLPIVVGCANAIINNYFSAKGKYILSFTKALGAAVKEAGLKKKSEIRDENKQ